jgi:hypothetical protein
MLLGSISKPASRNKKARPSSDTSETSASTWIMPSIWGPSTAPNTSKKTVSGTGFPGIAEAMKGLAKATSAMMASETNAM